MRKRVTSILVLAGALGANQVLAADQIDWNSVPGSARHGSNDVSRDFVDSPDPLNVILSNTFTAWSPDQLAINQADTSTGKAQRQAVVNPIGQTQAVAKASTAQSVSPSVYTETQTTETQVVDDQQAGVVEEESVTQNTASESTSGSGQATSNKPMDRSAQAEKKTSAASSEAQARLAPNALIIESSLNSAIDQVRGLKNELDLAQSSNLKADQQIGSYKAILKEMKNDLKVAGKHERQLVSDAQRYPDIAQSSKFRDMTPAIKNLRSSLNQFESKARSTQYWNNQDQAKADLDRLEKQLSDARDKVKSFSSDQLNISVS